MPYRAEFAAHCYYHVFNRGNNRQPVFFEREHFAFFLRTLRECYTPEDVEVVAYCLMPNHYHLLVHVLADNTFSQHMQSLSLRYTKSINESRDRVGSLFQGRFKSLLVDRDEYLLHLSRYIHLNPVEAGMVKKAEEWEFSSYREYLGLRNGTLPKPDIVLSQFPSRGDYRRFVESYSKKDKAIIEGLLFD